MTVRLEIKNNEPLKRGMHPELNDGNRLMFITHPVSKYTECDEVRMVLKGGCNWIQVRMKEGLVKETVDAICGICQEECEREIDLCIDDDINSALACCATAVHLGKNDIPVSAAWDIVEQQHAPKRRFFVGATANTFSDIQKAVNEGASYIGLGPYRFTETKKNLSPILGIDGYRKIVRQCRESGILIPIFAIGGIELEDVKELMQTGIDGIAVSGAIINAPNPEVMTRLFLQEINRYKIDKK